MLRRFVIIVFLLGLFLVTGSRVFAYYNPGQALGFVNDYAHLLKPEQINALNKKLQNLEDVSSNQIAIVTIKSLKGDTINNFAVRLFADWKIGQAKKDNGVLILVAEQEHKMRIEVGYGLEGALPDAIANQIIVNVLRPAFKTGNYYQGLNLATDQIIAATKGEYKANSVKTNNTSFLNHLDFSSVLFLLFIIFNLIISLWRHLAKSKSWWEGGIIGGGLGLFLALLFFRTLVFLITLPLVIAAIGLVLDFLVSRVIPPPKAPGKGRGPSWWWFLGGGGPGRGGFGGGGFGGFGGGGSGGGGASGSW